MLNLNSAPYWDDFDASKNYHKILFVPGNPVQARELTQIQSQIQHQIKQQGDHIFSNGTVVIPGNVYYDNRVIAIKLARLDPTNVDVNTYIASFVDQTIVGSSGVQAKVVWYEAGTSTTSPFLFIKYTANSGTIDVFSKGESLTYNSHIVTLDTTDTFSAPGAICHINQGVYYLNGYFIGVDSQTVTVTTSNGTNVNKTVGLQFVEQVVTAADDVTLYDNAQGYSNQSAPGADRYKISLTLATIDYTTNVNTETFIKLLDIVDGFIAYLNDRAEYSEIGKMLARRTYDESGDFIVTNPNAISITAAHYRNNFSGEWAANTFYMKGDYAIHNDLSGKSRVYYTSTTGISGTTPPTWSYGAGPVVAENWTRASRKGMLGRLKGDL